MKGKYFVLFSCCVPIKGAAESIIMDLQRGSFLEIPNLLFDILEFNLSSFYSVFEIKKKFDNELDEGIEMYFNFLEEKEYGFFTDEPEKFPKMDLMHYSPFKIVSSVVNYDKNSQYDLEDLFLQIIDLGVQIMQVRLFDMIDFEVLKKGIKLFKKSRAKIIEIIIEKGILSVDELTELIDSDSRINIIVHSSDSDKKINNKLIFKSRLVKKDVKEIYAKNLFVCNIPFFVEAQSYNVGLNRKLCIDFNGDIKNYVSHRKTFGNVLYTRIKDVIENEVFSELWNTSNDSIEKCNECQFRYMCLSNSDLESKNNEFIKVDTCNFIPKENVWI